MYYAKFFEKSILLFKEKHYGITHLNKILDWKWLYHYFINT